MGVEEKEKTSVFSDKYHVVTLHGEVERALAVAVSQNIRKMDILGNGELRVEILDSVGEPGQTMINVFNHVIENTTFILFFRTEDFFKDKLNGFAVSVSLEDRIHHHDPQRHYTLIPLDVEKTTKIKGKPCFNQLIGAVVSSDGAFDERNENKIRKMIRDKLFRLNADRVTVNEEIQEGQNRQARDICSLVLSADTSGYRQSTQQLNNSGTSLSSSTLTTDFENNTSGIASAASEGTRDLDHEARNGTDFETSPSSAAQRTPDSPSFQRSQDLGLNTQSSRIPSGGEYASVTSNNLTATAMQRDRDSFRSASVNQPSILNPSNMGEHCRFPQDHPQLQWQHPSGIPRDDWHNMASINQSSILSPSIMGERSTADTFQRQTSSHLPHSVDMDVQGSAYFCVPKLISPSRAHGNPFGCRAEARTGQRGLSYEQRPQQQYPTHFPNPYGQLPQPYPQVRLQQQWQHPTGSHQEYWNKMGARPKTRIPSAPMSPGATTRRCESAPVEGGGRQEDDTLFSGSGEELARSCHSSLGGERGRNERRKWKDEAGRGRGGGGGGGSGAVIAQRQTSTNSHSNPPNNQVPLSEVGKTRVPTPSSPYLLPSVVKGEDSKIDCNVTIPEETLRETRQATTPGSQFASDNRKGEQGSVPGQGQPTGSAEYPHRGGEEEMRRDNGTSNTTFKGKNASPDSKRKTSEEAQRVDSREGSHFPQEYPLSSRATLSPENGHQKPCRDADCTNSAACKEAELTMPTHAQLMKGTSATPREEPPDSNRKQEQHGGCLTEDTPKGIPTQPCGPTNCRRPGSSKDDTDIFGSFPELDDVMSEMSKCSLTPPSSPKFGNYRSNQSSLQYDCAPSYYSDQEYNGPAAASHRQQNQGPRDESQQQQQLQQPSHQQRERVLNQQQEAREKLLQPHQQYEQQYRQQDGEGFAELNGRSDRSRSSGDTDSGRGTI